MTFTVFSIAIIMLFAVIAVIEIYQGLKKGFFKAMVAFGMALLCMMIAVVLAPPLSELIANTVFAQYSPREICVMLRLNPDIAGDLILPIASLLMSILLFIVLFLLLLLLRALLAFAALDAEDYALSPKLKEGEYSGKTLFWLTQHRRVLGGIVGGMSAVLITMVITSPLMGALDVSDQLIDTANDFDDRIWDRVAIDTAELDSVQKYAADIPGNVFYQLGGKHMFAGVATTKYRGQEVHLLDEVEVLKSTLQNLGVLLDCLEPNVVATPEDVEKIHRLCADIEEMTLLEMLVADFVSQSARGWLDGKLVMGIEKPQVHPTFSSVWDQTLQICANTSVAQSKKNAVTVLRIYAILLESELTRTDISEYSMILKIKEHDVVDRIHAELLANKNMTKLEDSFKKALLKTQIDFIYEHKIFTNSGNTGRYNKLMQSIAQSLTDVQKRGYINEERLIAAISSGVEPYLDEYGLNFSDSMLDIFSEAIADNLINEVEEISPDDVVNFLSNYR